MKYFQETTEWAESTAQNHIYYLSDDKTRMVGYIRSGTIDLFKFKNPIRIDTRGRKFKVLDRAAESDQVYFGTTESAKPAGQVFEVEGSGGKRYQVAKSGSTWTCTCQGFTFRRKCRHIDELAV